MCNIVQTWALLDGCHRSPPQRDYFVDTASSQQTTSYCTAQQPYTEKQRQVYYGVNQIKNQGTLISPLPPLDSSQTASADTAPSSGQGWSPASLQMRHPPAVMPLWKYIQVMRMQIFTGNQMGPLCIAAPHLNHIIPISCNQVI